MALITGTGSCMGKASAKVFVRQGACAVVADINGAAQDAAKERGNAALALHFGRPPDAFFSHASAISPG